MTKQKISIFTTVSIFTLVLLGVGSVASATTTPTRPGVRQDIRNERGVLKDDIRTQRGEVKTEIEGQKSTAKDEMMKNRANFKTEAESMRRSGTTTPGAIKDMRADMKTLNKDLKDRTMEDVKAKREAMRGDIKKQIETFKEGKKVKLDDLKKGNLQQFITKIFEKLGAQVARLSSINTKVEAKIVELKGLNLNTSGAEALLPQAKDALSKAQDEVASAKLALTDYISSASTTSKEAIRAGVQKSVDAIKGAREKYKAVITALPENRKDDDVRATSTATTTSN